MVRAANAFILRKPPELFARGILLGSTQQNDTHHRCQNKKARELERKHIFGEKLRGNRLGSHTLKSFAFNFRRRNVALKRSLQDAEAKCEKKKDARANC